MTTEMKKCSCCGVYYRKDMVVDSICKFCVEVYYKGKIYPHKKEDGKDDK